MKLDFSVYPILYTQRLRLRALAEEDIPQLLLLRSNKEVNRFLDRPVPAGAEDVRHFIEKISMGIRDKHCFYWAVAEGDRNGLIGTVCLWNIDTRRGSAEIGYELYPDYWGRGLMQEAVAAVLDFGFEQLGLQAFIAVLDRANERSVKLLKRNQFIQDTDYSWVSAADAADLAVYFRLR